jgi:hypothetical protein
MLKRFCLLASICLISATLSAQVFPAAEGSRGSLWVGVALSTFNPDYGCANSNPFSCGGQQLLGIAPSVDANHLLPYRIGLEGEAQFLHWRGPGPLTESSYLVGPRMPLWRYRVATLNAKFLLGDAHMSLPKGAIGNGDHFAYAPGAGVDVRVTRRINARVDYECQIWPTFARSGLTPNGFSFGVSYALLR